VILPSLIKRDFPTKVGLLTGAYATVMGGVAAVASGVAVPISQVALAVGTPRGVAGSCSR